MMSGLVGQQLGNCQIVRLIGSGGMGLVYLAEQPELARQVAIKVVRATGELEISAEAREQATQRFLQEARAVASLDHPHILPLYAYGEERGIHYLVMPYVPDGSLADLISTTSNPAASPPFLSLAPIDTASLIVQVATALQYAHDRGVIHRDVKPQNILVRMLSPTHSGTPQTLNPGLPPHPRAPGGPEQRTVHALLADFGLARMLTELSGTTGATGTALYMSPEQCRGHAVPASDQYALACVAYLLLAGRPVFIGTVAELHHQHLSETPLAITQVNKTLPPAVDGVLRRALAKQPEQRYPHVHAFAEALHTALAAYHAIGYPTLQGSASITPASLGIGNGPAAPISLSPPWSATSATPAPEASALPFAGAAAPSPWPASTSGAPRVSAPPPPFALPPSTPAPDPDGPAAVLSPRGYRIPQISRRTALGIGGASVVGIALVALGISRAASSSGSATPPKSPPSPVASLGATKLGTTKAAWTYHTGGPVSSSPSISSGMVFIGSNDGYLYALDATTGAERWRFSAGAPVTSSPHVGNRMVYFGTNAGAVCALNADTGALVWRHNGTGAINTKLLLQNGLVYAGWDTSLLAFDATTGRMRWRHTERSGHITGMDVLKTILFYSAAGAVACLDAVAGTLIWRKQPGLGTFAPPRNVASNVCVGASDGHLYMLNGTDGALVWSASLGGGIVSRPATGTNGEIYVSCQDHKLHALVRDTGEPLWTFTTQAPVVASPTFDRFLVYCGSLDNSFYAVDAYTGKGLWRYPTGGEISSTAAISNGIIYVGSSDSSVYALHT